MKPGEGPSGAGTGGWRGWCRPLHGDRYQVADPNWSICVAVPRPVCGYSLRAGTESPVTPRRICGSRLVAPPQK